MTINSIEEFKQCYPGWANIAEDIRQFAEQKGLEIIQIKEKFGELRCYTKPYDVMIHEFEDASHGVCLKCGKPGKNKAWSGFWLLTLCDEHGKEHAK